MELCLLGAPNAGKSSLFNIMCGWNLSAVSDLKNTTDDSIYGYSTDLESRT